MIDTSALDNLSPITQLVIHIVNLEVIEKSLDQNRDDDALRKQGLLDNSQQAVSELERTRKRIIGRIEGFDDERVNEIEQVRERIADVGPEAAVGEIQSVVGGSEAMRQEIVSSILEWEREAGLRDTSTTT